MQQESSIVFAEITFAGKQMRRSNRVALAFDVFEDENISRDVCRRGDNMFDDSFIIIVLQYCHVVYVTLPTHKVTRDETAATAGRVR